MPQEQQGPRERQVSLLALPTAQQVAQHALHLALRV